MCVDPDLKTWSMIDSQQDKCDMFFVLGTNPEALSTKSNVEVLRLAHTSGWSTASMIRTEAHVCEL